MVEVTDTTLSYDRDQKGSLYARAGVADYWIVNLSEGRLEVYRDPISVAQARYGWIYGTVAYYTAGEQVSPLAAPQAVVPVADLLP